VGLAGLEVGLVSVAGDTVVAISGTSVWRSDDRGTSFVVAAVLTAPARALALTASADAAIVSTNDGVVSVTSPRTVRRILDAPADALATCGADVVALGEDGVYRFADGARAERLGDRPPARALACDVSGGVALAAAGVGTWSSADGQTWREERFGLGRSGAGIAVAGGRTWLAAEDGLYTSPDLSGLADLATGVADPAAPTPDTPSHAGHLRRSTWAWLLPRVALAFDGWSDHRAQAGWRVWVLLTVTLGRRAPHAPLRSSEVLE
jgi:hypothetical protein